MLDTQVINVKIVRRWVNLEPAQGEYTKLPDATTLYPIGFVNGTFLAIYSGNVTTMRLYFKN